MIKNLWRFHTSFSLNEQIENAAITKKSSAIRGSFGAKETLFILTIAYAN